MSLSHLWDFLIPAHSVYKEHCGLRVAGVLQVSELFRKLEAPRRAAMRGADDLPGAEAGRRPQLRLERCQQLRQRRCSGPPNHLQTQSTLRDAHDALMISSCL